MLQPICGYVDGHDRAEARVRDLRDRLVVHQHGARPRRQLADALRPARAARIRRRLGESRRHEGDVGVVPGDRARPGRRLLQHGRVARLDAGGAAGRVGDPDAQLAVRVRAHRRDRPRLGQRCGCCSTSRPRSTEALSAAERDYILAGQETHLAGTGRPSIGAILAQRNFWGIAIPRFLADPTWGTLTFWLPLYLTTVREFDLTADRDVRLAAVPRRRSRLHVRRHDQHDAAEVRRHGSDQRAALRVHRSAR